MLEKRGADVPITEDVVKAAAVNKRSRKEVMIVLLEKRGADILITEGVVKAAAGNKRSREEVMTVLLEKGRVDVLITEEMVKIIAKEFGQEVITVLLEKRGAIVPIREEVAKAARKEKAGPRLPQPLYKGDEGLSRPLRPIPRGFIQRLDDGHFQVKTRNVGHTRNPRLNHLTDDVKRCNDTFEDIIAANTLEDAEALFRNVDRYDRLRGPIRKLINRLLGLYWTFAPPTHPGPTRAVSPEEGGQNLDAHSHSLENVAKEPEAARHTPATVKQDSEVHARSNSDAGHGPTASAQDVPNVGVNLDGAGQPPVPPQNNQQNDQHVVFICLPLGRPGGWRLRHAKFTGRAGEPWKVTDETMFNQVRAEIGRYQVSRGPLRFLFPLRVSKAEYYEVSRTRRLRLPAYLSN